MPRWARAVLYVGILPTIAFWLLYLVTMSLVEVRTVVADQVTETRGVLTRLREHDENTLRAIRLLETICRRLGRNDFERETCR